MTQTSRNRWVLPLLVVLASAATGISLMLTSYHLTEGKEPLVLFRLACGTEEGGCADVLASPWAVGPAGIPTATFGAVYFGALGLWYLTVGRPRGRGRYWQAIPFGINLAGALFSAFLLSVMLGGLHKVCWWCTLTHLINFAMLFLAWKTFQIGREEGETSWPPKRLAFAGLLLMAFWTVLCLQGLAVSNLRKSAEKANEYASTFYEDVDLQRYLQQRASASQIPIRPDDPVRGNPAAPHTAVVFSDFQCPGCRSFATFFETRVAPAMGDRLKLIYKHYPLNPECNPGLSMTVHLNACEASDAAEAARELGGNDAFWKMHDALFRHQEALGQAPWTTAAREIGLDPARLAERMASRAARPRIVEDTRLGRSLGLNSTPTVYLDGRKLDDWRRVDLWEALVQ